MISNDLIMEMVRKLEAIEIEQKRLASLRPLFQVLNQKVCEDLTADASNYATGDYDTVFLVPTAARIIHGFTGGVAGRLLFVRNSSAAFNISLPHQSATATAENRIATATLGTIVVGPRTTAILQYVNQTAVVSGGSRWLLLFPIA